ncbi:MAG: hypothetical protein JO113_04985, partial [Candidatus Eremiobacteraeota bacterium]|nr:hypothetical protein [Candidatus Eremiobacteraeota bacterium]
MEGATQHFQIYYDNSLGANGFNLASDVLDQCEAGYFAMTNWFGVEPPTSGFPGYTLPFQVHIKPGSSGGSHGPGCNATGLNIDAFNGTDGRLANAIVVAEASEVFMSAQNGCWDCSQSIGEGLSRVALAELYPDELPPFATAASWLNSGRPNFVDFNNPTDQDAISTGCVTLFINYLRFQLGFSMERIVRAGAGGGTKCLRDVFGNLTGLSDAFDPFAGLLQGAFPIGNPLPDPLGPGGLADNPFPIVGHPWHTIRNPDGSWQQVGDVNAQVPIFGAVAAVAATFDSTNAVQFVFARGDGHLLQTRRYPDGWQPLLDVGTKVAIPGPVSAVAGATATPGEAQYAFTTSDGHLWHTIHHADDTWQPLGDFQNVVGIPSPVAAVAATSSDAGEVQFLIATNDGWLWHTI